MRRKKITVAELVSEFQALGMRRLGSENVERYGETLAAFVAEFGTWRAKRLTPADVLRWFDGQPGWKSGWTIQGHRQRLQRVFNWGVRAGLLKKNPIKLMEVEVETEAAAPMAEAEFRAYVRAAHPAWRRFLYACWWSGARPGELAAARWRDVDWERGLIVLKHHKTARKTKKPRLIYCPPAMMRLLRWLDRDRFSLLAVGVYDVLARGPARVAGIVRRLAGVHPSARTLHYPGVRQRLAAMLGIQLGKNRPWELGAGARRPGFSEDEPIFLGHGGRAIRRRAWGIAMTRLRRRTGGKASLYGMRRAFAHRCLKGGVSLKVTSLLMGHADTAMVQRHYLAELGEDDALMREGLARASGGKGT